MVEAEGGNGKGQSAQKSESYPWSKFWLDLGTLGVLIVTMIFVIKYAGDAKRQNVLTQQAIETNTRPYLSVNIVSDGFRFNWPLNGMQLQGGQRGCLRLPYQIFNQGKLPADAIIDAEVVYRKLGFEATDVTGSSGQQRRFIFPSQYPETLDALSVAPLDVGDWAQLLSGGFIQIGIRIDYGSHETKVCQTFPLDVNAGRPNDPRLGLPRACAGQNSNYAN